MRNVGFGSFVKNYRLLFVVDSNSDDTTKIIHEARSDNSRISQIRLSRNFGKESALIAALCESENDYCVPLDVDLKDPPELIPQMFAQGSRGSDIVFGGRASRTNDSRLYRKLTGIIRRIFGCASGLESTVDFGEYLVLSNPARDAGSSFSKSTRYMKGLTQWVGFTHSVVDCERGARNLGQTRFGYRKLPNLAIDGLASLSPAPLRYLPLPLLLLSFGTVSHGLYFLGRTLASGTDVPAYPHVMVAVLILGGLQLLIVGFLGEYVSQILRKARRCPESLIIDPKSSENDLSKL